MTSFLGQKFSQLLRRSDPQRVQGPPEFEGDHTAYRRFIVLTTPRTGSSFLRQLLRSHPRVVSFGEIFHPGKVHFNTPGFDNKNKALLRFRNREPADFLKAQIFRAYPRHIAAVGFKVFYFHLDTPRFHAARDYLASQPELHVLHLKRRNLLRAYLSNVVMDQTGVAGIMSPAERQTPQVVLDPRECIRYFEDTLRQQDAYAHVFENTNLVTVTYEDLTGNHSAETTRVLTVLGVEPAPLRAKAVRQEVRPLWEVITNYEELRATLSATPWAQFFDD